MYPWSPAPLLLSFVLEICSWLVEVSLLAFLYPGGYALGLLCISFSLILLPRDTSLYPSVLSQLAWGYAFGFWRIPPPCPNLLVDTLCSFGVSPFLLIFLLGYNFSLWGIHLPCHNLLGDTACAFDVSPFLLIFLLGYNFSFLGYPSALSQLAWGYGMLFRRIPSTLNLPLGIQFSFLLYPSTLSQLAQGYTTCTFTSQA